MKSHRSHLLERIIKAGLRVKLRQRVVCVGIDDRGRIIDITTNQSYMPRRGRHAEERMIFRNPRSLSTIILARISKLGKLMPIECCDTCAKLIKKRGIKIEVWE